MHELPVTQSVLEISLRHAEEARAERITGIYLVIGQLSSFVDESIRYYWDIISEGTIAKGAELHFKRVPAAFRCEQCEATFEMQAASYTCPYCSSDQLKLVQGEEFYVESIDVEP